MLTKHELKQLDSAFYSRMEILISKAEKLGDKYLLGDKRKRFQASSRREGRIL
jgi:hypothetical protein